MAGVGWLSGTIAESLGERVFANFRDKNIFFTIAGNRPFVVVKRLTHTHRHVPSNTLFDVEILYFGYVLVVQKLSKSGLSKSLTKAGSTKALRKLSEIGVDQELAISQEFLIPGVL